MSIRGQIAVTVLCMFVGLAALGLFVLIARPDATNANVAIGTLVYSTAYILMVPRAERFVRRFPALDKADPTSG